MKRAYARTVELFRQAEICDIRVVIGHRAAEMATLVKAMGAEAIENPHYENGMFSSIKAGIKSLAKTQEAFFLLPVDVPLVKCQSLLALIDAWKNSKKNLYPTFINRRGHPPIISTTLIQDILAWNGIGGLRSFLMQHERHAAEVAVIDECHVKLVKSYKM